MAKDTAESPSGNSTNQSRETDSPGTEDYWLFATGTQTVLWLVTMLWGIALASELAEADFIAVEGQTFLAVDGSTGTIDIVGFGIILVAIAGYHVASRYGQARRYIRSLVSVFVGLSVAIVLTLTRSLLTSTTVAEQSFLGLFGMPGALLTGGIFGMLYYVHPEWYVLNVGTVACGTLAITFLGSGLTPTLILLLLLFATIWDAYAVYKSGIMQEGAASHWNLYLPMQIVVPYSRSYSMLAESVPDSLPQSQEDAESESNDRESPSVAILGIGDIILPALLPASAVVFVDAPTVVPVLDAPMPAFGAIIGALGGMGVLLYMSRRFPRVHAGLPPLCLGLLTGYFVGAFAAGLSFATSVGL